MGPLLHHPDGPVEPRCTGRRQKLEAAVLHPAKQSCPSAIIDLVCDAVIPTGFVCPGYWAVFQSTMGISGEAIWAKLERCVPVRGANSSTAVAARQHGQRQQQQQEEHRKRQP